MAWHDGVWWPLYTTAWYSPHVSEYMFDPYSLTHVLHGIFFQLILGMIMQSNFGAFLIAMMLELFWEVVENSEAVIRKFRENSGTSQEDRGDSIQNILGDMSSCAAGFALAKTLEISGLGWVRFAWIIVSEIFCIIYMRDSLILIWIILIFKIEALANWQAEGIPEENGLAQD